MRSLDVECLDCRRSAAVNVDRFPGELYVPDMAERFVCSACGSRHVMTRPNWLEYRARGMGRANP